MFNLSSPWVNARFHFRMWLAHPITNISHLLRAVLIITSILFSTAVVLRLLLLISMFNFNFMALATYISELGLYEWLDLIVNWSAIKPPVDDPVSGVWEGVDIARIKDLHELASQLESIDRNHLLNQVDIFQSDLDSLNYSKPVVSAPSDPVSWTKVALGVSCVSILIVGTYFYLDYILMQIATQQSVWASLPDNSRLWLSLIPSP